MQSWMPSHSLWAIWERVNGTWISIPVSDLTTARRTWDEMNLAGKKLSAKP